jgi:hypothetical protein
VLGEHVRQESALPRRQPAAAESGLDARRNIVLTVLQFAAASAMLIGRSFARESCGTVGDRNQIVLIGAALLRPPFNGEPATPSGSSPVAI